MRIWIDGFEANVPQRVGSGQVAFELLRNLEEIDKKNEYTILLAGVPLDDLPKERLGWQYKILKIKRFKTWVAIPLSLFFSLKRPDIIFSPTHYGPLFSPVKSVITIFDLAFLKFPKFFNKRDLRQLSMWTKISVRKASHVITISKFSKKDIIKNYQIAKDMITVAYPGYDSSLFKVIKDKNKIERIKNEYQTGDNYIIYIGTIQPRKNLIRLFEAFADVSKELKDLNLIVVGKTKGLGRQGWMYDEILKAPEKLGVSDKVKFCGFVPSHDLPALISGAKAFIQPSLWEGFGIPVLESMACSTPVIASNVSSLPEVVGNAGILVDPYSHTQIEQAIRVMVTDYKLRNNFSKKSLEQVKKFSWRKMAKEVLEVLEKEASR